MSRRQVWIAALALALLPATAPASVALTQQTQGRAFTLGDALGVRSAPGSGARARAVMLAWRLCGSRCWLVTSNPAWVIAWAMSSTGHRKAVVAG